MATSFRASNALIAPAYALTGCNLAAGISAILWQGDQHPTRRATLILVGALCDTLDGPLARRSGILTDQGAAADGIADVITCGIAPAVLLDAYASRQRKLAVRFVPGLYIAAIAWRVARYGFPPRTSDVFRGLPVTGAGVLMAAGFQLRLPPRLMNRLAVGIVAGMMSRVSVPSGVALTRRGLGAAHRRT